MKKFLILILVFGAVLYGGRVLIKNDMAKTNNRFVVKPFVAPEECEVCDPKESTGFLFTGRIILDSIDGEPYVNGIVFISEVATRAFEFVGKTDENGTFELPVEPKKQFHLYAWYGDSNVLAKYDGHFYYNDDTHVLYMTPTGQPTITADKGDIIIEAE